MRITSTVLSVLVVAAVATVAVDTTTYAATGRSVLLGRENHADHRTTFVRAGDGAALKLTTRPGSSPLIVNSKTKVERLNADTVDGLHASALQLRARTFVLPYEEPRHVIIADIPVTPGVFEVVMHLLINTSSGSEVKCGLTHGSLPPTPDNPAYAGTLSAFASGTSTLVTANASTVFTFTKKPDDRSMRLQCTATDGDISFAGTRASRVTLIPLASESITNLPPHNWG